MPEDHVTNKQQDPKSLEKRHKRRRKRLLFALPMAIQCGLAVAHCSSAGDARILPEAVYSRLLLITTLYSLALLPVGFLSAISMTMEGISAKIKKDQDIEHQWLRDYLKAARKYLPSYNASFGGMTKKIVGAAVSALYVFALFMDGYIGNGVIVLASVCMVWFGIWSVAKCNRLVQETRKLKKTRDAKNAKIESELMAEMPKAYLKESLVANHRES